MSTEEGARKEVQEMEGDTEKKDVQNPEGSLESGVDGMCQDQPVWEPRTAANEYVQEMRETAAAEKLTMICIRLMEIDECDAICGHSIWNNDPFAVDKLEELLRRRGVVAWGLIGSVRRGNAASPIYVPSARLQTLNIM